jgi:uncharacterized membrane protein
MLSMMINFANLLLAALTVGAMFGAWLVFNPAGLRSNAYITLQQRGIKTLNRPMPAIGGATALLTVASAVLARDHMRQALLIVAVVCFLAAGLITRFLNQPINAIVMTWNTDSPPANWTEMRDRWWRWHVLRLIAGLGGLSLLIAATLSREWQR